MSSLFPYRQLERKLQYVRWLHRGREAPEEEDIVEEMADLWWELSPAEQAEVRAEGPTAVVDLSPLPVRMMLDGGASTMVGTYTLVEAA